jgi:hypothetical protein
MPQRFPDSVMHSTAHGALAPNAKLRREIVPSPLEQAPEPPWQTVFGCSGRLESIESLRRNKKHFARLRPRHRPSSPK